MAKKGFFSWFRKDKTADEIYATQDEQQIQQQAAEQAAKEAALAEELQASQEQEAQLAQQQANALQVKQEAEAALALEAARQEALAAEAKRELARLEESRQAEVLKLEQEQAAEREAKAALAAELAEEQLRQAKAIQEQQRKDLELRELTERENAAQEAQVLAQKQAVELAAVEQQLLQQHKALAEKALVAQEQAEKALAEQLLAAQELAEQELTEQALAEKAKAEAETLAVTETSAVSEQNQQIEPIQQDEPQQKPVKEGLFARLKRSLMRTSENIGSGFIGIFKGKKIDDALFEELEEQLLIADVGVETTTKLIAKLTEHASRKQLKDAESLYELMRDEMQKTLEPVAIPLVPENASGPFVILMVGVNGVGKTTTIGKLAKQYQAQGKTVLLAAGDTFRAAAVEQLQVWGQRNDIPVIAQHTGADSASVLFDAFQAAKARKVDVLIADTAGRLQNKAHLMEELKKVVRVMKKLDPEAPHEVMLTLDASTGQNAISQAQLFQEAVGVTGITLSKLDGTAKGGVIFAIADKFSIPIRYIGVGEQIDDLRTFNAADFIEALFSQENASKDKAE
jgi:fused signal recognition particle receptor